jgi:Putative adhesin
MRPILSLALLAAVTGCTGAFGERAREDVNQSIAVAGAPVVHVTNVAGSVRVDGGPKPAIALTATKYGYDWEELRSITIDVRREGNAVFIKTVYGAGVHHGGVRYRITVPSDASLQISNTAGAVDVAGIRGDVAVDTQAGEITANVGRVGAKRSIDLRATTGAITLDIAPGSSAVVTASSTVGDFSSDIPGITKSRQNLVGVQGSGTIGSGSAHIRLATTTGAIALRER